MTRRINIGIVGASLAGLMTARTLKEQGYSDFVVWEGKSEIGLPLKCGEAVEEETLVKLFGEDVLRESFVVNRIERHEVIFRNVSREFIFPYVELDRPQFEKWLALPIASHIQTSQRVNRVNRLNEGFRVETPNATVECALLVLATGANYALHEQLQLITRKPALGYAYGGIYRSGHTRHATNRFLWKLEEELEGYVWEFPKSPGESNIGAAGLKPKFLKSAVTNFTPDKPSCQLGGHYPIEGALPKIVAPRLLLTGDAAGFVFAGTGEGISYAIRSGQIAGRTLVKALQQNNLKLLTEYAKTCRKEFGERLKAGVLFKRMLQLFLQTNQMERVLKHIPLRWLESLIQGRRLPWTVKLRIRLAQLSFSGLKLWSWVWRSRVSA